MKHCKKPRKAPWLIAGTVVAVIALVLCAIFFRGVKSEPKSPAETPMDESYGETEIIPVTGMESQEAVKAATPSPESTATTPPTPAEPTEKPTESSSTTQQSAVTEKPVATQSPADEALPPTEKPDETDPSPAEPTPAEPTQSPVQTPSRDGFETEIFAF